MNKRLLFFLSFLIGISLLAHSFHNVAAKKDKTPPTGSIVINDGETHTTSRSVILRLTADDPESGVGEVRYCNDGNWDKPWESYSATKSWILTSGDGVKTVYYQIRNNDNILSIVYSDTIILDAEDDIDPSPSPSPTPSPSPSPTPSSAPLPTTTPIPAPSIVPSPSPTPTTTPSLVPLQSPNPIPTSNPTPNPTSSTSPLPSAIPELIPIPKPSTIPESPSETIDTFGPSPSPQSNLENILSDFSKSDIVKPIVVSVVVACGILLLIWSLREK